MKQRPALAYLVWAALLAACCYVAGCGLTGGSIPTGDPVLKGVVVTSLDPEQAVSDAVVSVATSGETQTAVADSLGAFELADATEGSATITVTPPNGAPLQVLTVETEITKGETVYLLAALEPSDVSFVVESIQIAPKSASVPMGQPFDFSVAVTGVNVSGLTPTWIVERGIGTVSAGGRFTARRAGQGRVRVQLGGLGDYSDVTVGGWQQSGGPRL